MIPAVRMAGITKNVGWHTFRRSFACAMGDREEDIKVVQELMRHSSSRLPLDVYQQGAEAKKRLGPNPLRFSVRAWEPPPENGSGGGPFFACKTICNRSMAGLGLSHSLVKMLLQSLFLRL